MYQSDYSVPQNSTVVYESPHQHVHTTGSEEDRIFLGPLLVGGLAGGALGYGIGASRPWPVPVPMPMPMPMGMPMMPMQQMPMSMPQSSMMVPPSCTNTCIM